MTRRGGAAADTMPMFDDDSFEVEDWAANNMNWSDVADVAFLLAKPDAPDYQEGWVNGEKEVIEWKPSVSKASQDAA